MGITCEVIEMTGDSSVAIGIEVDGRHFLLTHAMVEDLIRKFVSGSQPPQKAPSPTQKLVTLASLGVTASKLFERGRDQGWTLDDHQQQKLTDSLRHFDGQIGSRASSQVWHVLLNMQDFKDLNADLRQEIKKFLVTYERQLGRNRRVTYGAIVRVAKAAVGAGKDNPKTTDVLIERLEHFDGWIPPSADTEELLQILRDLLVTTNRKGEVGAAVDDFFKKQEDLRSRWEKIKPAG